MEFNMLLLGDGLVTVLDKRLNVSKLGFSDFGAFENHFSLWKRFKMFGFSVFYRKQAIAVPNSISEKEHDQLKRVLYGRLPWNQFQFYSMGLIVTHNLLAESFVSIHSYNGSYTVCFVSQGSIASEKAGISSYVELAETVADFSKLLRKDRSVYSFGAVPDLPGVVKLSEFELFQTFWTLGLLTRRPDLNLGVFGETVDFRIKREWNKVLGQSSWIIGVSVLAGGISISINFFPVWAFSIALVLIGSVVLELMKHHKPMREQKMLGGKFQKERRTMIST